jgi:hypothetical protein
MRSALLAAAILVGCSAPAAWRPTELASLSGLSLQPSTGTQLTEDLAMGIDGALVLPSPDGGPPIEVPHHHPATTLSSLKHSPRLDPAAPTPAAPGLGSLLWARGQPAPPFRPGVELYRSRAFKLMLGTRALIDERYPDAVTTDMRHEPVDDDTSAVVGLRLGF